MNKAEKQVMKESLNAEKKLLKELKQLYTQCKKDCSDRIKQLELRPDFLENMQTIIYQQKYQQAILGQVETILEKLNSNEYKTINDYLHNSYHNGYIGTMYSLQSQGIPLVIPIDQENVVKALQIDSKLSKPLYDHLGEDINRLKNSIRAEVSRGIVEGYSWVQVADKLAKGMNNPFDKSYFYAVRIARTEGHRVQEQAVMDSAYVAKDAGADEVRQWDSALDSRVRDWHREADGQIRELDEPFDVGGEKLMKPGDGSARNAINCRCHLLLRAKWALDEAELQTLKDRAEFFGLDKSESFEEYKSKYLSLPKNADKIDLSERRKQRLAQRKAQQEEVDGTSKSGTNKWGETIVFSDKLPEENKEMIVTLSNEYNTRLQKVVVGSEKSAGSVDVGGATMHLSSKHGDIPIHEFAHTLASSYDDKIGLTDDKEFWKEIRKIRRAYMKDVGDDSSRWISSYEHSSNKIDEFLAEAFTQIKSKELGIDLSKAYGSETKYSKQVVDVIDKYFKKKPLENNQVGGKINMNLQLFANGKDRSDLFGNQWTNASLRDALNKYVPNAVGIRTETGKINYTTDDSDVIICYDTLGDYFRIESKTLRGKRRYFDINGEDVSNITIDGRTRGRTKEEYESITHFKNTDGRKE